MTLENRIEAFIKLGIQLQNMSPEERKALAISAASKNIWFDEANVFSTLNGISRLLEEQYLREWLYPYQLKRVKPKTVGVVMEGNTPLAGFHDFLAVLICGHTLHAKLNPKDDVLLLALANMLIKIEPAFANQLEYKDRLKEADAIIATGADNIARYFEQYFANRPHIIRKTRSSIGVLTGRENSQELQALGDDIFLYYGLGSRSVSKVYVPDGYTFDKFFEANKENISILDHHRYQNNYDYNKSILLVNRVPHFDNGFILVTESDKLVSPISVLHYENFSSLADLRQKVVASKDRIQCMVSAHGWLEGSIPFGETRWPMPWDYADGIDTLAFLQQIGS